MQISKGQIKQMNTNKRGLFIVLEGLDKCGKSTQVKLLSDKLQAQTMQFPDRTTNLGIIISDYLKGQREMTDEVIHLLFSANRWELKNKILETLEKGINIVCDRYAYSGVAFSAAKGIPVDWCKRCDAGLPKPDIIIYLRAPIQQLSNRGDFGAERYENQKFQSKVQEYFDEMADDESFTIIDALKTKSEVFEEVLGKIDEKKENLGGNIGKLWVEKRV